MIEDKMSFFNDLAKILIFKVLKEEEKKHLLKLCDICSYEKNEYVISEGSVQTHMFAVIKGTVNVVVKEKSGKQVFISAIGQGDVFGEAGIFLKVKRTANVISAEKTVLLRLERKQMLEFIKNHKEAGIKILMLIIYSLLRKLRDANQEIAFERKSDINQDDIDSILEEFLYTE
ncbi:MAG: cyclic nucleotide-binding domain-containing protein [Spirochaetales bacterium]|nr:cyclic nucleotide-binding domain-containing protein [Spirochaetales bacterium]